MTPFRSYAQNFEDLYLRRALADVGPGFYIDIGAQDPDIDSVSRAFHEAGWRGVHVEPIPAYAARLRAARPGDLVIEAAVSDSGGHVRLHAIAGSGLSTADAGFAARHVAAGWPVEEIEVATVTLASLLAARGDAPIHWLKIDVEGMEAAALRSWGDAPQRPWIVAVEATEPNSRTPSHEAWESELLARGYTFAWFDGLNRYYVHETQVALASSFGPGPNIFDPFILEAGPTGAELARLRRLARREPMADHDTTLTADAVIRAYRLALGRLPESVECIVEQQAAHADYDALVSSLISSVEFAAQRSEPLRSRLLKTVCRGKPFFIFDSDHMLSTIKETGDFEPYVLDPLTKVCRGADLFLDIGCNVGYFSTFISPLVEHVLAIDARAENVKISALNNDLHDNINVRFVNVALSDENRLMFFKKQDNTSNWALRSKVLYENEFSDTEVIQALRVDDVINLYNFNPTICKIDVEGMEHRILSKSNLLSDQNCIIITEYSENFIRDGSGVRGNAYLDLFLQRRFSAYLLCRFSGIIKIISGAEEIQAHLLRYVDHGITHVDIMFVPEWRAAEVDASLSS